MSVKIRLRRMGKKKQPHYRIVVADSRSPRDGRFVEILGYYNPITRPARLKVDLDRIDYWLGEGAIASPTVDSLVARARVGGDGKVALAGSEAEATVEPDAEAADGAEVEETGAEAAADTAGEGEAAADGAEVEETESEAAEPEAEAAAAEAEASADAETEEAAPEAAAAADDAEAAAPDAEADDAPEADDAEAPKEDAAG